jgi:NAD-dependent SIR2 family protein deacetylase
MPHRPTPFKLAAAVLREADAVLIGAGAGMGVDSGLPDFRGREGFWRAYPAIARLGLSFEEIARPTWFTEDPELAWAFYGHRLNLYRKVSPHPGFTRLLEVGKVKPFGYFVFTSNVDGQFQTAGFAHDRIAECHGSIHHFQCAIRCTDEIWEAANERVIVDEESFRARPPLPRCRTCDSVARPNVLMFGDGHWIERRSGLQEARFEHWLAHLEEVSAKLVVVECGAGTAIPSVRFACEAAASRIGGTLIRINPRESEAPEGHIGLGCGAAEGIARICG